MLRTGLNAVIRRVFRPPHSGRIAIVGQSFETSLEGVERRHFSQTRKCSSRLLKDNF